MWEMSSFFTHTRIFDFFHPAVFHPQLLVVGGLYWFCCLLIGQLSSFTFIYLYSADDRSSSDKQSQISSSKLWLSLSILELACISFFAVFLANINSGYASTFVSTTTGKEFCVRNFREASSDRAKFNVLDNHPSYYKAVRKEVASWVNDNWVKWNDDKPEWFTTRLAASVPRDMIPDNNEETNTSGSSGSSRSGESGRPKSK